jgi:hypothetical protein
METKNYELFTMMDNNRQINVGLVKRLKKSIEDIGFIESRPVIVNESMVIIDGQHRFQALKELGLPIIYSVINIDMNKAMISLNMNQLVWSLGDWIKSYASKGIPCYETLVNFEETYHLGISNSILIVLSSGASGSSSSKKIRDGKDFVINSNRYKIVEFLFESKKYLPFWKTKNFVHAVVVLFNNLEISDVNKVLDNIQIVRQQATMMDYLKVFENILNKRKKTNKKTIIA